MRTLYYRSYQAVMRIAMKFIPWRDPELIKGEGSLLDLAKLVKEYNIKKILIVTDQGIVSASLLDSLLKELDKLEVNYFIYDRTVPNPTIDNIEEAVHMYENNNCEGIIAFGGGSPIDCAKLTGARIAKPNKRIEKMKGLFKVLKTTPPLFVVPTTAGTGAEATLAAVFSNKETNEKYPVMDTSLIPHVAVLDPLLTIKLPPHITAETGMDALTHAVESYIGRSNTNETKQWSIEATELIFDNIYEAYENGSNINTRSNMQTAAYLAGKAFTRAYVGYVHAIAHTLGGFYNIPHGLANAIILPHVLDYYGESIYSRLAELADVIGIGEHSAPNKEKAKLFIDEIRKLNENMGIPNSISNIQENDIPIMVKRALKEANPLYPVPKILYKEDITELFRIIKA